ncbi:hypothetical protein [Clostridium botulinum]|uniref:DUF86 domain-containing protein n=1 Tax=Clostridium botulinum CFSAN001627 TaxID=1232189 RepID=M1ZSG6_CLOBO|nr:hypothetical protein [Clostridium botulinum]EKN42712.1 hypothetical protein CFSAN001627_05002 [Clostridium botulinum CFSAN001627]APC81151.1 hypothetical protein NPD2_492 [Clostridium botulinum]APC85852.1 hypothetical protein NPD12_2128 [Clostridium botulinum]AXG94737.1 hypothetical protein AGE31_03235 [Clostridium botulinum]MBY6771832.1 hypothetical protein [Clostridium botulinum]
MNKERLLKIIEDMKECKSDIDECIDVLEKYKDNKIMIKLAKSSLRQLFVSFHTILEDLCSIVLKELKKFKVGITLSDSIKLLKDNNIIDKDTYIFLEKSRLIRNRISYRYKEPSHQELFEHIIKYRDKIDIIIDIAKTYL